MLTQISLEEGRLVLRANELAGEPPRVLGDLPFTDWIARYRSALTGRPERTKGGAREAGGREWTQADSDLRLLPLGRELYEWLDGPERWMERLLEAPPPFVLEISRPRRATDLQRSFLEVPWELVADRDGFLASDLRKRFSVVRRIGKRASEDRMRKPSEWRPRVVFMAASPVGLGVLDFEKEEAAILDATKQVEIDLVVEEGGTLDLLAARVSTEAPDVIHVSCHGELGAAGPALVLEDEVGDRKSADARDLLGEMALHESRLFVVSACHTGEPNELVESLAAELVDGGAAATLGFSSAVLDAEAIQFAGHLYHHISLGVSIEEATGLARSMLLNAKPPGHDWHLPRLYLGAEGGGRISVKNGKQRLRSAQQAKMAFLDSRSGQVPVASVHEFVGRRRQIQEILRSFHENPGRGVLIHGMGRAGKSSLAARVATRLPQHAVVVVFEHYRAADILEKLATCGLTEVERIARSYQTQVRTDEDWALREALQKILNRPNGPASQFDPANGQRPLLMVVDDLERVLGSREGGAHLVKPEVVPALRTLIDAFAKADTDSHLLLTSRFTFELPPQSATLLAIALPSMSEVEGRKQAAQKGGVSAADPGRIDRCVKASRGNAGLQDLLVTLALRDPAACDTALQQMEQFTSGGALPAEGELRALLENIAVDSLLGLLSASERRLLRESTIFNNPVPIKLFESLGAKRRIPSVKSAAERLVGLGLWETYPDIVDREERAVAVNALTSPRVEELSDEERKSVATDAAPLLLEAWGGPGGERPPPADLELLQLTIFGEGNATVVAAVVEKATKAVMARLPTDTAYEWVRQFGRIAFVRLQEANLGFPLVLLWRLGEAFGRLGEAEMEGWLLGSALKNVIASLEEQRPVDPCVAAGVLVSETRRRRRAGQKDGAAAPLDLARKLMDGTEATIDRARTLLEIAEALEESGEREKALGTFGDVLEICTELKIQDRELALNVRMAALEGLTGHPDLALSRLSEAYDRLAPSAPPNAVCDAEFVLGTLRWTRGERDEGLRLLRRAQEGFAKLGNEERAADLASFLSTYERMATAAGSR